VIPNLAETQKIRDSILDREKERYEKNTYSISILLAIAGIGGLLILSGCTKESENSGLKSIQTEEAEQVIEDREKMVEEQEAENMAEKEVRSLKEFEKKVEEEEESPVVKKEEQEIK